MGVCCESYPAEVDYGDVALAQLDVHHEVLRASTSAGNAGRRCNVSLRSPSLTIPSHCGTSQVKPPAAGASPSSSKHRP